MVGDAPDYIFAVISNGGLSSEGRKLTKNATTNKVFIQTFLNVLSRLDWTAISCHDGLSPYTSGYCCIRMDAAVLVTLVGGKEGE